MEWLKYKKEFNRWKKTYNLEEGWLYSGESIKRLVRINEDTSDSERRLVVPMLDVFNIIHQSHIVLLSVTWGKRGHLLICLVNTKTPLKKWLQYLSYHVCIVIRSS